MTETAKTLAFVAAAGVCAVAAASATLLTGPAEITGFEQVGEPFYPDFTEAFDDAGEPVARNLTVTSFDEDTAVIKDFSVKFDPDTNLYEIAPYGYPADAEDRLGETAAGVVGIEREALQSRREADWARYGVIDPGTEDATELAGRGTRITLTDAAGNTLADYILGKPVEGRDGLYYVRKPREKAVYRAAVPFEPSTRFADWVDDSLLGDATAADLREVRIFDYSVDEQSGSIAGGGGPVLSRDTSADPWALRGLDEATERVNTAAVNGLARELTGLKIVGVRPKPDGLRPDLTFDPAVVTNSLQVDLIRRSLAGKGFYVGLDEQDQPVLVGKEGQVVAATEAGVAHDIYFGSLFTGTEFDAEVGSDSDVRAPKSLKNDGAKDAAAADGGENTPAGTRENRYVFVAARLDRDRLGEPPVEPTRPDGLEDKPAADNSADESGDDESGDGEQTGAAEPSPRERYESDLATYRTARAEYDRKLKSAEERVAELNERFGDWYYVVDAESAESLKLSRAELVEPKPADAGEGGTPGGNDLRLEPDEPGPMPERIEEGTSTETGTPPLFAEPPAEEMPAAEPGAGEPPAGAGAGRATLVAPRPAAAQPAPPPESAGTTEPAPSAEPGG